MARILHVQGYVEPIKMLKAIRMYREAMEGDSLAKHGRVFEATQSRIIAFCIEQVAALDTKYPNTMSEAEAMEWIRTEMAGSPGALKEKGRISFGAALEDNRIMQAPSSEGHAMTDILNAMETYSEEELALAKEIGAKHNNNYGVKMRDELFASIAKMRGQERANKSAQEYIPRFDNDTVKGTEDE